ncbi:hypothetical protein M8C21_025457 [Ambrosia artemisiifolia]|uniref:Uncharacterized protein n=1 Tax=Ambrosia artemisiifolia TaxID=4212 RepID=A0AAD5BL93_AMBAR|nr:hypothetical protein M8C21_025457 [Ambrosia artemisiifolia]
MEKSDERSFEDPLGGKDDSVKYKKRAAVASAKLGAARYTNRDKLVCLGHGLDKSLQRSNMTQVRKLHQVPPAGAGPGAKGSSVYNLRSKIPMTEGVRPGAKSSSAYNPRSKNQITEGAGPGAKSSSAYNARSKNVKAEGVGPGAKSSSVYSSKSKNPKPEGVGPAVKSSSVYSSRSKNPKAEGVSPAVKSSSVYSLRSKYSKAEGAGPGSKSSSVYNLRSKNPLIEGAPSYNMRSKVQRTEDQNASINSQNRKTAKKDSSNDSLVAMQKTRKNHPLTSQHELFSRQPIYHIRWEDEDVAKGPLGYSCMLCNKDLSCGTDDDDDDDDDDEYNDDIRYDVDDEYYDEYDLNPRLLPAVDILSCGHAYHTDCFQKGTPKEQSSDPQCILCHNTS